MAKAKTVYTCTECGGQTLKWQGQCPHCNAWNTLSETVAEKRRRATRDWRSPSPVQSLEAVEAQEEPRLRRASASSIACWAAAWSRGGVVLIGGDPGIGKSTLLLQALSLLSAHLQGAVRERRGERAAGRAARAPARARDCRELNVLAEIQLEKILAALAAEKPDVAVIDSIQTLYSEALHVGAGQRRAGARVRGAAHARRQDLAAPRWFWSATSPRKARSPVRACSSTWSTPCSTSKATRTRASG